MAAFNLGASIDDCEWIQVHCEKCVIYLESGIPHIRDRRVGFKNTTGHIMYPVLAIMVGNGAVIFMVKFTRK